MMEIKTRQEAIQALYNYSCFFDWSEFDKFRDDEEVAFYAITKNPFNYKKLSKRLQRKDSIIIHALSRSGFMLRFMDRKIKRSKKYVLLAIKENGESIKYAIDLNDDLELALEAVKQTHEAAYYLSSRFQDYIGRRNPEEALMEFQRINNMKNELKDALKGQEKSQLRKI